MRSHVEPDPAFFDDPSLLVTWDQVEAARSCREAVPAPANYDEIWADPDGWLERYKADPKAPPSPPATATRKPAKKVKAITLWSE